MNDERPDSLDEVKRRARRRLVGAAVLAIAAAIVLPLVFEHEPPPLKSDVDIKIPPVEGTKFEPKVEPRPVVPSPASSSVATPPAVVVAAPKPHEKAPEKASEKPAEKIEAKNSDPPKAVSPEKPAPAPSAAASSGPKLPAVKRDGKHAAQIMAVRNVDLIAPVLKKAKDAGLPVFEEKITVQDGVVTRVRVGPYATRAEAETVVTSLKKQGFEAIYAEVK